MIKLMQFALFSMLASAPAMATDWSYVSSLGDEYAVSANENGVVLTSLYPKAWFIEAGANSTIEKGHDVIFIGRSCDAFHKLFGNGKWGQANGGFLVTFDAIAFGFPRQELTMEKGGGCEL